MSTYVRNTPRELTRILERMRLRLDDEHDDMAREDLIADIAHMQWCLDEEAS